MRSHIGQIQRGEPVARGLWRAWGALVLGAGSFFVGPASAQWVGPGTGRDGTTPSATPYRDPNLNPAMQDDYVEPDEISHWIAPSGGWQIGVPVSYRGYRAYAVRDGESYVAQFDPAVRREMLALPSAATGFPVDLVLDLRIPERTSIRATTSGGFATGISVDGFEYLMGAGPSGSFFGTRGRYSNLSLSEYHGSAVTPWYQWWLEPTQAQLEYLRPHRYGYRGPIDGQYVPGYVPVEAEPVPVPPPTSLELARAALAEGRSGAVELYLEHLNSPAGNGDWSSRRALAMALLGERRASDAAAVLRLAYLGDPSLSVDPVGPELYGRNSRRLGEFASIAGRHALEADSASGWLLLAVVLQAQGRDDRALELLGRAEARRLEVEIAGPMRAVLAR